MTYPNRAKCLLCNTVIESFHQADYVSCKCGEYAVFNGTGLDCESKGGDWSNFRRVDDLGNEIAVKHIHKAQAQESNDEANKETRSLGADDAIHSLDEIIKSYENLPDHAKTSPVNHYDLISLMSIMSGIFKLIR